MATERQQKPSLASLGAHSSPELSACAERTFISGQVAWQVSHGFSTSCLQ